MRCWTRAVARHRPNCWRLDGAGVFTRGHADLVRPDREPDRRRQGADGDQHSRRLPGPAAAGQRAPLQVILDGRNSTPASPAVTWRPSWPTSTRGMAPRAWRGTARLVQPQPGIALDPDARPDRRAEHAADPAAGRAVWRASASGHLRAAGHAAHAHADPDRQGAAGHPGGTDPVHHHLPDHPLLVPDTDERLGGCCTSGCSTSPWSAWGSISALSNSMQQAMLYTFLVIMPLMLLSGLLTPVRNMPEALQLATYVNPLRFGMNIVRDVYLEGAARDRRRLHPLAAAGRRDAAPGRVAVPQPHVLTSSIAMSDSSHSPARFPCSPRLVLTACALAFALAGCAGAISRGPRRRRPTTGTAGAAPTTRARRWRPRRRCPRNGGWRSATPC